MDHFDNMPIHGAERVQKHLAHFGLRTMEHRLHSRDLAPGDLFLFDVIKKNFLGSSSVVLMSFLLPLRTVRGFRQMSFWNGYADCGYTATMAENM
jgi:hypothetical protein